MNLDFFIACLPVRTELAKRPYSTFKLSRYSGTTSALKYPADRKPITERTLRRLLERVVWEDQRALWAELRAVAG